MVRLTELLETVQVAEPQEAGGLQVFGLRWANPDGLSYATLDEAMASGRLEVTEVNEGGSVPTLKLVNRGDVMVFLMAGEQLIGAKQNRVLNADIMAAAQSELPIPVSCVEAGRWRYRSPKFAASGTMSHGSLRKMMSKQAHFGFKSAGAPTTDQGAVWSEVARKLDKLKSPSPSHALYQAYEDYDQRLKEVQERLAVPEGCSGVAFASHGKIAGVDLFDKPDTLGKYWAKLVRAYALDALEEPEATAAPVSAEAVRTWLRAGTKATAEPFKSPGLGHDVRLESKDLVGAGLVIEDRPVHVELFVNEEGAKG